MRFSGKVVFVTGAARGMGACIAQEFAKEGADVVAVSRGRKDPVSGKISNDDLDKVVKEIKATGRKSIGIITDVSKSADVKNAVSKAIAEFGKIDILVNNAGVIYTSPIIYSAEEEINAVIDVDLKGSIFCCKYIVPYMARQKYGKIINISSGAGLYAEPNYTAYSAAKYGVIGLTESLAAEVSHYNINVNAVCPGAILTPMLRRMLQIRFPGQDPDIEYAKRSKVNFSTEKSRTKTSPTRYYFWLQKSQGISPPNGLRSLPVRKRRLPLPSRILLSPPKDRIFLKSLGQVVYQINKSSP